MAYCLQDNTKGWVWLPERYIGGAVEQITPAKISWSAVWVIKAKKNSQRAEYLWLTAQRKEEFRDFLQCSSYWKIMDIGLDGYKNEV